METRRFLPLGIRTLGWRDEHALSPDAVLAVAAPELTSLVERAVKIAMVVAALGGLVPMAAFFSRASRWLFELTGASWLADLLTMPLIVIGVFAFPLLGGFLGTTALNALWPRPKVATLALDDERVILTLPAAFGTGLPHEVFTFSQGALTAQEDGRGLRISGATPVDLELPLQWRVGGSVVGALAKHPRKAGTHVLGVEQGFLVLRPSSA